jgi:hypothetical protein
MSTYTKTLYDLNGSKAMIIPKKWLDKFGDIVEVLVDEIPGKLVITPLPNTTSLTAKRRTKNEGLRERF